jgi:hypothetical protein
VKPGEARHAVVPENPRPERYDRVEIRASTLREIDVIVMRLVGFTDAAVRSCATVYGTGSLTTPPSMGNKRRRRRVAALLGSAGEFDAVPTG